MAKCVSSIEIKTKLFANIINKIIVIKSNDLFLIKANKQINQITLIKLTCTSNLRNALIKKENP